MNGTTRRTATLPAMERSTLHRCQIVQQNSTPLFCKILETTTVGERSEQIIKSYLNSKNSIPSNNNIYESYKNVGQQQTVVLV